MPTFTPKYPDIEVALSRVDSNAFMLLGVVKRALREGLRKADLLSATQIDAEIKAFMDEATAGDYDHLVQTCMKWVEVS